MQPTTAAALKSTASTTTAAGESAGKPAAYAGPDYVERIGLIGDARKSEEDDIALNNAEAIARSIDDLQVELEQLKTALGAKDTEALEKFFAEGKSGRDEWLASWEKK